jgi:hypothetical protein
MVKCGFSKKQKIYLFCFLFYEEVVISRLRFWIAFSNSLPVNSFSKTTPAGSKLFFPGI